MNEKDTEDFHHDNNDNDEEIFREIIAYYGEDTINSAALSNAPPPKIHRKKRHLYSALSIVCAVVFLTGTVILGGVVLKGKQPLFSDNNSSDIVSSEFTESSNLSESSENIENSSSIDSGSDIFMTSSQTSSYVSSDGISSQNKNQVYDSSASKDENNISDNTDFSEENSDKSNNALDSSQKGFYSSTADSDYISSIAKETADIPTNSDKEYSLPEIPDEGTVASIHTDLDNNSITNPYDNVTTGDTVQAGIGIFLMVLSLASALVLNKLRAEDI